MFTRTITAAVAAAIIATSAPVPTAFASDFGHEVAPVGRADTNTRDRIIAGAVIGIAAALLGSEAANDRQAGQTRRKARKQRNGTSRKSLRISEAGMYGGRCIEVPVYRWRNGREVYVGSEHHC
jgi:hypothetical protein